MSNSPAVIARDHFYRRDSSETSDYSGSSGLPTPADEEISHPIDFVVYQGEVDDPATPKAHAFVQEVKQHCEEYVPRVRSLSKAVTKAKKFAQTLTRSSKTSKRFTSTSTVSTLLPTPASIRSYDAFYNMPIELPNMNRKTNNRNRRVEEKEVTIPSPHKDTRKTSCDFGHMLFSLPNTGIERYSVEVNPSTSDDDETIEDVEDLPTARTMEAISTKLRSGTLSTPDVEVGNDEAPLVLCDSPSTETLETLWEWPDFEVTPRNILILLVKVACFLPWCIAVGGAIVMCPTHFELVAFKTGYQPSLRGIHRFAYLADCAMQHVGIFFAFIAVWWWWSRPLGAVVLAGVLACVAHSWGDFALDRSVPLGEDDRQAIYLVFKHYGIGADSENLVLQKTDAGYFASDKRLANEIDSATME